MKVHMMMGLPASGKTTEAEKKVASGNWVRVNRDLLRKMLHFDKWSGRNESITVDAEKALVRQLLRDGNNVVIDDTNLNPGNRSMWSTIAKEEGASFTSQMIDTPLEECILRDSKREAKVGSHVIYKMALQYGLIKDREFIVCDIDGTIADGKHRLHHLYTDVENLVAREPRDWKAYFAELGGDTFRQDVWDQVAALQKEVILVSARPEDYRAETEEWLARHIPEGGYLTLIMRAAGDRRDDDIVKEELHDKYFAHNKIVKVFDDRPRVIRMWRGKGLDVVDVGTGVEF